MRVFLTGATGFLGSEVARLLCDRGDRVRALVRDARRADQLLRVDGANPGGFAPLSGFWRTADGWLRTHANYPHHRARLLTALDLPDDAGREDLAAAGMSTEAAERQLAALGYESPQSALTHLAALSTNGGRRGRVQQVLLPTLLDWLSDTPDPDAGLLAYRRISEELIEQHGLTMQQYNVLRILRGARTPLPTMEIAERMIEPAPGITRHINNLEERGLVRREQWGGDRRCVLCQISPAGLKVLEALDGPVNEWDEAIVRNLSEEQVTSLLAILDVIRASVGP